MANEKLEEMRTWRWLPLWMQIIWLQVNFGLLGEFNHESEQYSCQIYKEGWSIEYICPPIEREAIDA